jgi:hypothetical protein
MGLTLARRVNVAKCKSCCKVSSTFPYLDSGHGHLQSHVMQPVNGSLMISGLSHDLCCVCMYTLGDASHCNASRITDMHLPIAAISSRSPSGIPRRRDLIFNTDSVQGLSGCTLRHQRGPVSCSPPVLPVIVH